MQPYIRPCHLNINVCTFCSRNNFSCTAMFYITGICCPEQIFLLFCSLDEFSGYQHSPMLSQEERKVANRSNFGRTGCLRITDQKYSEDISIIFRYCNRSQEFNYPSPPPPVKVLQKNFAEYVYVILGVPWLQQNYVITKKLNFRELVCIVGGCKDLRFFHAELRDMYVTPEKRIRREFFCIVDYAKLSQSTRK